MNLFFIIMTRADVRYGRPVVTCGCVWLHAQCVHSHAQRAHGTCAAQRSHDPFISISLLKAIHCIILQ